MEKKRQRSVNFTPPEVRLLIELVSKEKNIIENKKTDTVTNKEKEVAWEKIEKQFNASSGISTRSASTLKLKYEGLKKMLKKKVAVNRQEMYKTGGGANTQVAYTDVEGQLLSFCSNIDGLESRYDCDRTEASISYLKKGKQDEIYECEYLDDLDCDHLENAKLGPSTSPSAREPGSYIELEENECTIISKKSCTSTDQQNKISDIGNSSTLDSEKKNTSRYAQNNGDCNSKWDSWCPKSLKTPRSAVLRTSSIPKKEPKSKFDVLKEARLKLVEIQKEMALREMEYKKMEFEQKTAEYETRMANLANEERRNQELHEMKMQEFYQK